VDDVAGDGQVGGERLFRHRFRKKAGLPALRRRSRRERQSDGTAAEERDELAASPLMEMHPLPLSQSGSIATIKSGGLPQCGRMRAFVSAV
jgi:hypothetical protein